MPNPYLIYGAGVIQGTPVASPLTTMERDNQGNSNCVGFTATSFLETLGALYLAGGSKSASASLDETATVWKINASGGAYTETLPPASTVSGLIYAIIKTDSSANAVTVKGSGSENINGSNTFNLTAQYKVVIIWSDGTQWWILFSN